MKEISSALAAVVQSAPENPPPDRRPRPMPRSLSAALAPIVLSDADGRPVRLGSLWEARPAVVVFLRHYG